MHGPTPGSGRRLAGWRFTESPQKRFSHPGKAGLTASIERSLFTTPAPDRKPLLATAEEPAAPSGECAQEQPSSPGAARSGEGEGADCARQLEQQDSPSGCPPEKAAMCRALFGDDPGADAMADFFAEAAEKVRWLPRLPCRCLMGAWPPHPTSA